MTDTIKNFYDLDAWKKAHHLTLLVYKATNSFPGEEKYGLTSQLRRASSSVGANIAEGFSRFHFKDKVKFYYQARGSVSEVQNFLVLARDLGYLSIEDCAIIGEVSSDSARLVNGMIRLTEKQYA
jgi:four helix bundle protein